MSTPHAPDRDSFDEALGRIIKVIRTDLGLERGDLADRAGISYSYMAAIENGQRRPSSTVLRSIAEALGLRTHLLVESAEARAEQPQDAHSTWWSNQAPKPLASAAPPAPMASHYAQPEPTDNLEDLISRLDPGDRALVRELVVRLLAGD